MNANRVWDWLEEWFLPIVLILMLTIGIVVILVFLVGAIEDDRNTYPVVITTNGETFYCHVYDAETLIATDCKHAARMLVPADAAVSWR